MQLEILKEKINEVKGSTFASITTVTIPTLKGGKKNPMQGRITKKVANSNVMIFSNVGVNAYESMVKRRMEKEGKDPETFTVQPRAWGTRVEGTPFVEHKDKTYLEVFFLNPGQSSYYLDGEPIEKDKIEGLQEAKEENEESQGGIENKVVLRTYSIDSITQLKLRNEVID